MSIILNNYIFVVALNLSSKLNFTALKKLFLFFISILILLLAIFAIVFLVKHMNWKNDLTKSSFSYLKNGDLVLRQGRSAESFAVYLLDPNSDFSHIGIVVVEHSITYIVHIVPDKPGLVRKDSPLVFLSSENASHFKVLRTDFDENKLNQVSMNALKFYNQHLTFDSDYDLTTDGSLYCTELVLKAFQQSNIIFPDIVPQKIKLLVGSYDVIMPGSFLVNSHFTAIEGK